VIDTITAQTVGAHVARLTEHGPRHRTDPTAVARTWDYLGEVLTGLGCRVSVERWGDRRHQWNLLAEPAGSPSGPVLDVGAHWDSVRASPGADDNASGVAAVLEVARIACAGDPPPHRLRLCLFGGEEGDEGEPADAFGGGDVWAAGSRAHVRAVVDSGEAVRGAIVLEMIGYRDRRPGSQRIPPELLALAPDLARHDRGDFVAAVADPGAGPWLAALVAAAPAVAADVPVLPLTLPPGVDSRAMHSDHLSYWSAGLPAVMLTDTAEFRTPHYHRASDTLDTLDLDFAASVTRLVAHVATAVTVAG